MRAYTRSQLLYYGVAVLAVMLSLLLRALLQPLLNGGSPYLLFTLAVLIGARIGGSGPGLVATALGGLFGNLFFVPPYGALALSSPSNFCQFSLFLVVGGVISGLNPALLPRFIHPLDREVRSGAADSSQRCQAELELRRLSETLEQRVAERTAHLEAANQELEAFAFTVSHDLRTPLRALQGFCHALLADFPEQVGAVGRSYAQRIVNAAEHLDTLIQDLLTYSCLSRMEIPLKPLDLNWIVERALAQLEDEVQPRQAQVTVARPLPPVVGNRGILTQVLVNLLSNAIKFVAPGLQPQVRLWAEVRAGWVRVWVADNGIGIDPEQQKRIFLVFERLHGPETYAGTGIGLAIVSRGIERLGGRLGVESQPGQGSRFWIELPQAGERP